MIQKYSLFLGIIFISLNAPSQNLEIPSFKNEISLKIGQNFTYIKDLNFSPLNYTSKASGFGSRYQKRTAGGNQFHTQLDFSMATLKTNALEHFDSDRYFANIEIGYVHKMKLPMDKIALYLGAQYHTYLGVVFFDDVSSVTFFGLHSVDLATKLSYAFHEKHQVHILVSLPFFGLLVRPPYTGWDKYMVENQDNLGKILTRGIWTSFNDYFGLNWNIGYSYLLIPNLTLIAQNSLRYYRTKHLDLSKNFDNQFLIGIQFNF